MGRNNKDFSYQTGHTPDATGAPLHDMTGGGQVYPEDFYSDKGPHHYGGHSAVGMADVRTAQGYRGQPDKPVTIYRAVGKHITDINPGDWVAINREYAKDHGEGTVTAQHGGYHILKKVVPAKHVRNPGDSPSEFGYYPD